LEELVNVTPGANPVKALDLSKLLIARSEGQALRPVDGEPNTTMEIETDSSNRYATIQKNGKTIATVYRSGYVETPYVDELPYDRTADKPGLALANKRIQQMLEKYGGHVEYIQDTRTQAASATAATLFAAQRAGQ
jgi:hypothetical protein